MPKAERFEAIVLAGHKGLAFEVPFDPGKRWGVPPVALRPGRRGVPVRGTIDGTPFESAAVSRMRRWFVLVTDETARAARIREGSPVDVRLEPRD